MAYENDRYPRWRQRWDENVAKIDREIDSWWDRSSDRARSEGQQLAAGAEKESQNFKQAADRAGDKFAQGADRLGDRITGNDTWTERTGDTIEGWWKGLKQNVSEWFDNDGDDEPTRAEIRKAWDDDDYLTERFDERRRHLGR